MISSGAMRAPMPGMDNRISRLRANARSAAMRRASSSSTSVQTAVKALITALWLSTISSSAAWAMFGAYTKNTLHNIHMRDFETLSGILGGSIMRAATYAAQMHLQSLGRSDRDEFLNKRLSMGALASAAVSRGAFSSILPMVADLGTYAMGRDPMSDTRVSGGAAQGALSNPSVGLANPVFDAARGITASLFHGEQFSQRDARALQGLLPFSDFLPAAWATNAMIGGLPNRDTHKHFN